MSEPAPPTTVRKTDLVVAPDGSAILVHAAPPEGTGDLLPALALEGAEVLEGPVLLDRHSGLVGVRVEAADGEDRTAPEGQTTDAEATPTRWFPPALVVMVDPDHPSPPTTAPVGPAEAVSSLSAGAWSGQPVESFRDLGWLASQVPVIRQVDDETVESRGTWADRAAEARRLAGLPVDCSVELTVEPVGITWACAEGGVAFMELPDGILLFDHERSKRMAWLNPAGAERWHLLPIDDPIPPESEHAAEETGFYEALAEGSFVRLLDDGALRRGRLLAEAARRGTSLPAHLAEPTPSPLMSDPDREVLVQGGEPLRDLRMQTYGSPGSTLGKLHSVELLIAAARSAGWQGPWVEMVERLRSRVGPSRTLYSVAETGGVLGLRLHWHREPGDDDAGWDAVQASAADCLDWRMAGPLPPDIVGFSVAPPPAGDGALGPVTEVEILLPDGEQQDSGSAHLLGTESLELLGDYRFHDQPGGFAEILDRLRGWLADKSAPDAVLDLLPASLAPCTRIGVMAGPETLRLVFNGVGIRQLLSFLDDHPFPTSLVEYVDCNAELFDHLRFDVELDHEVDGDGLHPTGSSFFGTI